MFGSHKSISGKYSIFRKCYFSKRKTFSCVWMSQNSFYGKLIPVFGSFKYFYRKCIKSGKRNQNPAKENESTTSNERCDRGATSGAMSDEWRAVRSSIDERACRTRTAHRSRRLSIDERWDRPDDRTVRRAVRSWYDEWRAVRSSIDERACWTRTAHRSRRSSIDERACRTRTTHRLRRSSIDERCDRPNDRTARSRRSRRSLARCDSPTSGAIDDRCSPIWALSSLTLSLIWALSSLSLSLSLFPEMNWSENEGEKSFPGQRWKFQSTGSYFPENEIYHCCQTPGFGGKWFLEIIFTQNKRTLKLKLHFGNSLQQ